MQQLDDSMKRALESLEKSSEVRKELVKKRKTIVDAQTPDRTQTQKNRDKARRKKLRGKG